ncbi:MAG: fumarylacetoacetate hydrolase family protein [Bacteroidales bacterium]|nr:fumarylacetoacetate hydrolase family protein [Bacteroidales bacterium]
MKIICIGRNYADHAREMNNLLPADPVFFMKPDSSMLLKNNPFFLPDFSSEIHHEIEVVLKISRLGKNIEARYAHRYYDQITVGIDFTARDLQRKCIQEGRPWEIAKAFDQSAAVGSFIDLDSVPDPKAIHFQLAINKHIVQKGNTKDMIFSFDAIISYISGFMTLKTGDLIFTGTPAGVGPVKIQDHLTATMEGQTLLDFWIK